MIFSPSTVEKVSNGTVTQTRRIMRLNKPLHWVLRYPPWQVGHWYAFQPGPKQKATGRIWVTNLRHERLLDATHRDAIREGFANKQALVADFRSARLIGIGRHRVRNADFFLGNPMVWVIEFRFEARLGPWPKGVLAPWGNPRVKCR